MYTEYTNVDPIIPIRTFSRPINKSGQQERVPEYYACNVFDLKAMSKRLSKQDVDILTGVMKFGGRINAHLADRIAMAVKEWAIEKGATHYCHWFQPQTGTTAEKHSAFLAFDVRGNPLEQFCSVELLQSEPDASSFPSGGIRSTFEARGYTGWDPSSPMFVMESENGKTLYIPSVFVSYHGDALDFKVPLLRSCDSLNNVAVKTLFLIGEKNIQHVGVNIGPEQEFFVVDKRLYNLRPDLRLCGRTIFGRPAAKGQELEDHYFANIPTRVQAFMNEVEVELYKLGVPIHTRHNEVAPGQFELAPIYESANIACDHNQLLMKVLNLVAERHGLAVLLHEKPFNNVNGSGKHVNWSLFDDTGRNLLKPGKTPEQNIIFLTFLAAFVWGIYKHADVLRASIASAGNEHRLGANEAPPAIMSVFLGTQLNELLSSITEGKNISSSVTSFLNFGVSQLQDLEKDATDRNRTSPIAFTGNKFEFRAVGSSASISYPTTILNAAMASGLEHLNNKLSELNNGEPVSEEVIYSLLREIFTETAAIRFEGNGYSTEWKIEAAKRGLNNYNTTPNALAVLSNADNIAFLIKQNIFSAVDIESRVAVQLERYIKQLLIEYNVAIDMIDTQIIPAAMEYYAMLVAIAGKSAKLDLANPGKKRLENLANKIARVETELASFKNLYERLLDVQPLEHTKITIAATILSEQLTTQFFSLRKEVDFLEAIIPNQKWPFPNYYELCFGLE